MPEDAAGDAIPSQCRVIEVHVTGLRRLFNAIDPSPFSDKDLDPDAEEFIVNWAKELPKESPLALLVYLDRGPGPAGEAEALGSSVRTFFTTRAAAYRRRLRELFRRGRTSLLIAVVFLAAATALSDLLGTWTTGRLADTLREGLIIVGWVAMWRPLELFLYDWWPIRAEARLSDRLAAMPVRIRYIGDKSAWRNDWPAAPVRD